MGRLLISLYILNSLEVVKLSEQLLGSSAEGFMLRVVESLYKGIKCFLGCFSSF